MNGGVGIQFPDPGEEFVLGGVGGQFDFEGVHPEFAAGARLVGNVGV